MLPLCILSSESQYLVILKYINNNNVHLSFTFKMYNYILIQNKINAFFAFYIEIQDGHQKWCDKDFFLKCT